MAIYIKEIYLPEDPNEMIEFAVKGNGNVFVIGEHFALEACNVQEPHGRLISAYELIEFIENRYEITWKDNYEGGIKDACIDVLEKISTMPTVIPASEEGSA